MLNGAGAVPKIKHINGQEVRLQRFISNLVPANAYQDHMPGDDQHLPYLGQISMLDIGSSEVLLVDSEDLASGFNLFTLPPSWAGMMTFAKQVSSEIFGGPPGEKSWVAMKVVPMGWWSEPSSLKRAASRTQARSPRRNPSQWIHRPRWSYDELRRVESIYREVSEGTESERHRKFVKTCEKLVGAIRGSLQGGTLDGDRGVFHAAHEKLIGLIGYGMKLLSQETASEFELRHFTGKAMFAMAFRRHSMSIFENITCPQGHVMRSQ